jgi:sialate O-acetylesterase
VDATLKDGTKQWLAVSMDAFTANVKEIGLPLDFKQAKIVNNLIVLSNVAGIKNGPHAQGNIEFWRSNYGTQNKYSVPGANGNNYDFGDDPSNDDLGYGSMQVHLFKERQTLFAFNKHREGLNADFGIGNNTKSDHPDWTFRSNLGAEYSTAKIYIYVK